MKLKILFIIALGLIAFKLNAQSDSSSQKHLYVTKQYASISIFSQSIVTFNYERSLLNYNNFSLIGELGIGMAEFSESEPPNVSPAVYAFNVWLPIQYSLSFIDFTATISPTFYKKGKLGFIDLNGVFGFRVNFSKNKQDNSPFLGIYYNSKIYRTISHPDEIYSFSPISVKFGLWF